MGFAEMSPDEAEKFWKDNGFNGIDTTEFRYDSIPCKEYPKPRQRNHLIYQCFNQSIEESYFFVLNQLRDDFNLHEVHKITDIFSASEQSAFWGASQQRLQIQQGQVSNYLATIGKLIKELFQIVRELRILRERLILYDESAKQTKGATIDRRKMTQAAEVTLRGYWVDLKDGGAKSPSSVYGMSSQLGFSILPDLFFAAPAMDHKEVNTYVDSLDFNRKVQEVLKRKLKAYCIWKQETGKELSNRRKFTIKFLRQHYDVIQLYISWVKPYLQNVKRLQMNASKSVSEDLIGSFEGSFTEIEILCCKLAAPHGAKKHLSCVLAHMEFRTRPSMDFHQDGYQHKGPVHVGRFEMTLRGYTWTREQIAKYKEIREEETLDMIGSVDGSIKEAIDSLGSDLREFLKEAGEKFPEDIKNEADLRKQAEKEKKLRELKGAADPFISVFVGFKDMFQTFIPSKEKKPKGAMSDYAMEQDIKKAEGWMGNALWTTYKNFKKAHRMVTW